MLRNNWFWIAVIALVVGGIGGVLLNRFGIPYLSSVPGLSWMQNLESSSPVVINRYQEVQFNEGANLIDLARQASTYTVSLYSQAPANKFLGNGIITSGDGMIIASKTNLPISGNVTVIANDGANYQGVIRALDSRSELAVITINAQNLPFAQFGEAGSLQASQRLIFLGRSNNAFVHDFALGQVSRTINNEQSLERVLDSEVFENTVQTSASLNLDYVGGPILDLNGKVVGLTKSNLGILIGEDLQTGVSSFLQSGKVQRPILGIKYFNLSDQLAKLKNFSQGGSLVMSLDKDSPAQKAGILANDLIVAIDNQELPANNFEKVLNQRGISPVGMTVIRNGQKLNLTATLGAE